MDAVVMSDEVTSVQRKPANLLPSGGDRGVLKEFDNNSDNNNN